MRNQPTPRSPISIFCAAAVALACSTGEHSARAPSAARSDAAVGMAAIRPEALRSHVLFLADDMLEGRAPGTRGYDLAARYVAAQFNALGLEGAGDGGSYFQRVPLRAMTRLDAECALEVRGASVAAEDIIFYPFAQAEKIEVEGPLVYAGFGIAAPDQRYDDTQGADLNGAIAVVFRGAPARFAPASSRAVASDLERKTRHLAARGAKAVIVVYTPEGEKIRPWAQRRIDSQFESMAWMEGSRPGSGYPIPAASITLDAFSKIADAKALWEEASAGQAKPKSFGARAGLRIASRFRDLSSPNVVGVLRGSDKALAHEVVIHSAHLDHLGVGPAVGGDSIYNGALDDAAGVATILEVARAFASLPRRPARSVLFLAVTAEEKGLLGSDYFAHHPTVPIDSIVANINSDGPNPMHEMFDVVPLGAEHSTLRAHVETAAKALGVRVSPDPEPEQVYFIRSDQYSFVKRGVPSIFPNAGHLDATGRPDVNRALGDEWEKLHYHKPSDEWRDNEHSASFMAKEARLAFLVGLSVANDPKRPAWNPGNFFATLRAQQP